MSARMDRSQMAAHRAMEIQQERHNPVHGARGAGATPSMGLSQFRGGKKSSYDEAKMQGSHLAEHLASLHGAGYANAFLEGMGMCGGARTGAYEGEGGYEGGSHYVGGNDDMARVVGSGRRPSKADMMKRLAAMKRQRPDKAGEIAEHLRMLRGGATGGGVLDDVWKWFSGLFGSKASAPAAPSKPSMPSSGPSSAPPPRPSPPPAAREESAAEQLAKYGIHDKSSFRKWAAKGGHPDKGGDVSTFQKVSGLAGQLGWSGGKHGGAKKPVGEHDGRRKRAEIVRKVMREKGCSMIEASKHVKQHNLY